MPSHNQNNPDDMTPHEKRLFMIDAEYAVQDQDIKNQLSVAAVEYLYDKPDDVHIPSMLMGALLIHDTPSDLAAADGVMLLRRMQVLEQELGLAGAPGFSAPANTNTREGDNSDNG